MPKSSRTFAVSSNLGLSYYFVSNTVEFLFCGDIHGLGTSARNDKIDYDLYNYYYINVIIYMIYIIIGEHPDAPVSELKLQFRFRNSNYLLHKNLYSVIFLKITIKLQLTWNAKIL